ncbi:hypothetical protein SAMN05878482_109104 [Peribacillus simplex]|uniref:Twin-arginine translocation signal domain-containing protein n=1 Tax=Peribacillus simplex TaxID=1478 RepID=A0A9X8RDQ1_9BACI|nr:hypothetical protein [Peribacillus simplex]SIS02123.1 hypothetical protein SAMN05878482_109104 [Peribacillus simplex]
MENKPLNRRRFLTYMGIGAAATSGLGILSETAIAQIDNQFRVKPKKKGF